MAFSTAFKTLYMNLAYEFHYTKEAMVGLSVFLNEGVDYVVDVTIASQGAVAAAIELAYLSPVNNAYQAMINLSSTTPSQLLTAVSAINNYVITATTADDSSETTADGKLKDFVNSLEGSWTTADETDSRDCLPYYWEVLSAEAGFDTSEWSNVCTLNPS